MFISLTLSAQENVFSGLVLDEEGEPVPFATAIIKGTSQGAVADQYGEFAIENAPSIEFILLISSAGFESKEIAVRVLDGQNKLETIYLKTSTNELEEVMVFGQSEASMKTEDPVKVAVIDTKKLDVKPVTLSEALGRLTGVKVRQSGGLGSTVNININGFSGRAIKYFKDGIPIDYLGEGFNISFLPAKMLDRVEVYKGQIPISLGADALGGGINFISKEHYQNLLDVSYEYGSFNTHRATLNAYINDSSDESFFGVDLFSNYSDNNYDVIVGVTDPETAVRQEEEVERFHDAFTNHYGSVYAGWKNKGWTDELRLSLSGFYIQKELQHGALMTEGPYGNVLGIQRAIVPSLNYSNTFLDNRLKVDQFLVFSRIHNQVIDTCYCSYDWYGNKNVSANRGEFKPNGVDSDVNFDNITSRTLIQFQLAKNHELLFNTVYSRYSRLGSDPYGEIYFASQRDILSVKAGYYKWVTGIGLNSHIASGTIENSIALKRYWYHSHGTDGSYLNIDEEQVTAEKEYYGLSEAVKYSINKHSFLRAGIELAYRLPEQGEIFGDGNYLLSNFELRPERSLNYNIAYRFDNKKLFIEPNLFYRVTRDQILRVPDLLPFSQYQNQQKVRGYGLEMDARYSLGNLTINSNVTYQEIRLFDVDDSFLERARLRNTPYLFGNIGIQKIFRNAFKDNTQLVLNYDFSYTHEFYLTYIPRANEPDNLFKKATIDTDLIIPTQDVHYVSATYRFLEDKFALSAEIKNIFNKPIFDIFRVQRPGRSFHLKLNYSVF